MVIPPVYAKDSLIRAFLATPWEEARAALVQADAIVFFGYSLPANDIQAERLFQRALGRNRSVTVTLINPSETAPARFARVVRDQPMIRHRSVDGFMKTATFMLAR